jgi:hypothetical protein
MPSNKTPPKASLTAKNTTLEAEVTSLAEKINLVYRRLGGLRYHVIQESANGNDLGPTDFVRLVDNIIDEA